MYDLEPIRQEVMALAWNDPAHDFGHTMRVFNNAKRICRHEDADEDLVLCAALLHDVSSLPKSHRHSNMSAARSARTAETMLERHGFSRDKIKLVSDAIRDHSFSAGKIPGTLEGKILQDADRLDALGAIGIARVFAVAGLERRPFYNWDDPFCTERTPADREWTLDHFYSKLLRLESMMNTDAGRAEAAGRTVILRDFLARLKEEI